MISDKVFIEQSLVDNIFFLRTMREFCANIKLSFFKNNDYYSEIARELGERYEELGEQVLRLANRRIPEETLQGGFFYTPYTLATELLTERLFEIDINNGITEDEMKLTPSTGNDFEYTQETIDEITRINNEAIVLTENFIDFCQHILEQQEQNNTFSYSYPLVFKYMIEEANLYVSDLRRLNDKASPDPTYVANFEYRFSEVIKRATQFIIGLSDPEQTAIITNANNFRKIFADQMNKYEKEIMTPESQKRLNRETLAYTKQFQKYLSNLIQGILNTELYFIVEPIFFDNILTEVNYFIFLLELFEKGQGI